LQNSIILLIFAQNIEYMTKSAALSRIRQTATSTIPDGGKAILYGSRARGDARKDSDWDILILLDKDTLDQSDYDNVSYPFVLLGCDLGIEINPIMYTAKEWESYRITPFYENVVRDGIVIV
jgi:predicted nucleotidyltransferase